MRVIGLVLLLLVDKTLGWHAFLGQEAVPTISGTSLESSLSLPSMSPSVEECQVALTSLNKISMGRLCLEVSIFVLSLSMYLCRYYVH